jgi:type II secretion system protein H
MLRNRRGFTLIEIVVVMIILVVVATIALPRAIRSTPNQQVDRAARSLVRDLEQARTRALAAKRQVRVRFYDAGNFYTAFMDVSGQRLGTVSETVEEVREGGLVVRGSLAGIPGVELPRKIEFGAGGASSGPLGISAAESIALGYNGESTWVEFGARGLVDPAGYGGVIYLVHQDDPSAVAAVTISGASALRLWRYRGGTWIN